MTIWEERISATSEALLVAEHEARYRFVRPLVEAASTWCDLGCGTATASSRAFAEVLPPEVLLVDVSDDALASAGLAIPSASTAKVDLTSDATLARLRAQLNAATAPTVITCFEVVEHLSDLTPLFGFFAGLVADGMDLCISVPNDAFTGVDNPFHLTAWGPDSLPELESVLPGTPLRAAQVGLSGSMVVMDGPSPDVEPPARPALDPDAMMPEQQLLLYTQRDITPQPNAVVATADLVSGRAWERQRETDLAYYITETRRLTARVAELEGRGGP